MFKKNQNIQLYIDKPVEIVNDEEVFKGKLQSSFGTTGKIKVIFDVNLQEKIPDIKGKQFILKIMKFIKY